MQDSNLLIYLYPNMCWTLFMHAQPSCRFSDCLPTCWSLTLYDNQGFATEICQQLRYSIAHTGLIFTALLLIEHNKNVTLDCVLLCHLIQNKNLRDVRSDIQLIWVFAQTLKVKLFFWFSKFIPIQLFRHISRRKTNKL